MQEGFNGFLPGDFIEIRGVVADEEALGEGEVICGIRRTCQARRTRGVAYGFRPRLGWIRFIDAQDAQAAADEHEFFAHRIGKRPFGQGGDAGAVDRGFQRIDPPFFVTDEGNDRHPERGLEFFCRDE